MNILVDGSSYGLDNVGDAAMLQVAATRLLDLWPGAKISVFTKSAERLSALNPKLSPLALEGRDQWFDPSNLTSWTRTYLPGRVSKYLEAKEIALRERESRLIPLLTHYKMTLDRENNPANLHGFFEASNNADLVLGTGGGYLNDAVGRQTRGVVRTIEQAVKRGIPTAMIGQGIGPVGGGELFVRLAGVLPKVGLIALREKKYGVPILKELGVNDDRVFVTGDDAIELAYARRPEHEGTGLGINIRMAPYAGMTKSVVNDIRQVIDAFRSKARCDLIPVPIDLPRDVLTIGDHFSDVKNSFDFDPVSPSIAGAIDQAGRCRVIVTGSYHAAIFGLAQGIPCIGLANSDYYMYKFDGLEEMYGEGAFSADLRQPGSLTQFAKWLDHYWQNADALRPRLLAASCEQIEMGKEAYSRLKRL